MKSDGYNTFSDLIGLTFEARHDGRSRCALEVSDELLNPNGVVHGGVIYSMADTGMGGALHSLMGVGESCATIEIKIVYLKPATGGILTCETKVIHKGKRIAVMESEVENDGRLIAKALGTFSILNSRERNVVAKTHSEGAVPENGEGS